MSRNAPSDSVVLERKIADVVAAHSFVTVDEACREVEEAGVFNEVEQSLLARAKKELVRKVVRESKGTDDWRLFANIKVKGPDGKTRNVYKREKSMNKSDYHAVVGYYKNYAYRGIGMANGWAKRAGERFGQFPLPFADFDSAEQEKTHA